MSDVAARGKKPRLKSNWILWWRINEKDLHRQVEDYDSLKITQSMRGIGLLLLILSAIITAGAIEFFNHDRRNYADVVLFLVFGFFIFRGQRWAMIGAMILWTIEKMFQLLGSMHSPFRIVPALIWWALYMHVFYFAFKIEQARRRPRVDLAETFD